MLIVKSKTADASRSKIVFYLHSAAI